MRRASVAFMLSYTHAGNYGAGIQALMKSKQEGFTDVVYLDARTDTYLEELSAANIFVVKVPPRSCIPHARHPPHPSPRGRLSPACL